MRLDALEVVELDAEAHVRQHLIDVAQLDPSLQLVPVVVPEVLGRYRDVIRQQGQGEHREAATTCLRSRCMFYYICQSICVCRI